MIQSFRQTPTLEAARELVAAAASKPFAVFGFAASRGDKALVRALEAKLEGLEGHDFSAVSAEDMALIERLFAPPAPPQVEAVAAVVAEIANAQPSVELGSASVEEILGEARPGSCGYEPEADWFDARRGEVETDAEELVTSSLGPALTAPMKKGGQLFWCYGYGKLAFWLELSPEGHHNVWVAPKLRGQGIAAQLVAEALYWAYRSDWQGKDGQFVPASSYTEGGYAAFRAGARQFRAWID